MLRLLNCSRRFCTAPCVKDVRYRFKFASSLIPHPQNAKYGGQEALFASDNILFIAGRGRGYWNLDDPGLYSKELAKLIEKLAQKQEDRMSYIEDPKAFLEKAVKLNKQKGETTGTLLTLHPTTGLLQGFYIGDSIYAFVNSKNYGFRKVRQTQQYSSWVSLDSQITSSKSYKNFSLRGMEKKHPVDERVDGQYIVIGTTGIWQNLSEEMINKIMRPEQKTLEEKAQLMAETASHYGRLLNYKAPYYDKFGKWSDGWVSEEDRRGQQKNATVILAKIIKQKV